MDNITQYLSDVKDTFVSDEGPSLETLCNV